MYHVLQILFSLYLPATITASEFQCTLPLNTTNTPIHPMLSRNPRDIKSVIYIGVILSESDKDIEKAFENGIQAANEVLSQSGTLSSYQLEPIIQFVPRDNVFISTKQACKILDRG
ncbi:unnamed protein product [Heterobilharzia americana]|nr:unnamed protein product [Heterobilharzia americana]